jgi:hypothetical protein
MELKTGGTNKGGPAKNFRKSDNSQNIANKSVAELTRNVTCRISSF